MVAGNDVEEASWGKSMKIGLCGEDVPCLSRGLLALVRLRLG